MMLSHVVLRCSRCGRELVRCGKTAAYHFGPQLVECPDCGHISRDFHAVELMTKTPKQVRDYCRDFAVRKGNLLALLGGHGLFCLVGLLLQRTKIDEYVNHTLVFFLAVALCFSAAFLVKVVAARSVFYKKYYRESAERTSDPEYVKRMEQYSDLLNQRAEEEADR